MRPERELKLQILADIAAHVEIYGRQNWDEIRERPEYADLIGKAAGESGKRKFFRWVKSVCEPMPADKTRPREGRQVADDAMKSATRRARRAAMKNLPAAPSPAYMLRAGAQAERNIDYLAEAILVWEDIKQLREDAIVADDTVACGWRIQKWSRFNKSITLRLRAMDTFTRLRSEIYDLSYMERFIEGVGDIIVGELEPYPDVQERVIAKLEALNKSAGMTPFQ
jgi:hypothetical protein